MTISVIIPTAGRPRLVAQLVEALRHQIFDQSFEIIVIDDQPGKELDLPFRIGRCKCQVLRGEGNGPARARNLGVRHAAGTYLLFLDDDAVVDPKYLARVVRELETRPGYAVSGMQAAVDRGNPFSLASEWILRVFVEDETAAGGSCFAPSNGLALRCVDFRRCGGFDPYFPLPAGEDREFCVRWIGAGFHIAVLEALSVGHHFPKSFTFLVRQQWRYGRGRFHYEQRVVGRPAARLRGAGFYLRMIAAPPLRYGLWRGAGIGLLCGISQAVIACGYVRERVWSSPEVLPEAAEV